MNRWLLLVVLACAPAFAFGQTLECSYKVVSRGSTRSDVSRLCGDPVDVVQKTIYHDLSAGASNVVAATTVEVHLEMWTYNFGPTKLMQRIWFEDGVVVKIESLDYGY